MAFYIPLKIQAFPEGIMHLLKVPSISVI